jgi:hypothetical protein
MSSSGQYMVACVYNGRLYYSSNYGTNWTLSTSSQTANWFSVSISNTGQYAVACALGGGGFTNNYIYWSNNYGVNWTQSSSEPENWQSVSISGNTGQFAYGCGTNTYIMSCLATN